MLRSRLIPIQRKTKSFRRNTGNTLNSILRRFAIGNVTVEHALVQSLLVAPLLVGDLPKAAVFNRELLDAAETKVQLDFNQKLGHLYEDALASLLTSSPSIELVEKNLQVQKDKHSTVGELDFLIRMPDGSLNHLELATKFYLAVGTDDGFAYPGPDSRDNYDRKIDRLLSHQLTLVERYKDCLPVGYRDAEIVVTQLIYGCLFEHVGQVESSTPQFCNPQCRRGKWLRYSEVAEWFSEGAVLELVPKCLWPVPFELLDEVMLERWNPTVSIERCQMIRADNQVTAYFVAPDEFPKQT